VAFLETPLYTVTSDCLFLKIYVLLAIRLLATTQQLQPQLYLLQLSALVLSSTKLLFPFRSPLEERHQFLCDELTEDGHGVSCPLFFSDQ